MSELAWYAVRVKPRHERTVASFLQSSEIEQLLPLYVERKKWADRYKNVALPLFPGYIFSRFLFEKRGDVLRTPGVVDIVRFGEVVLPVNPEEMQSLKTLVDSGLACEPYPALAIGERVKVCGGPFFGQTGTVVEVRNKLRLVLSVTLLNRSVLVDLDREWVQGTNKVVFPHAVVPSFDRVPA